MEDKLGFEISVKGSVRRKALRYLMTKAVENFVKSGTMAAFTEDKKIFKSVFIFKCIPKDPEQSLIISGWIEQIKRDFSELYS